MDMVFSLVDDDFGAIDLTRKSIADGRYFATGYVPFSDHESLLSG
jgi:hypothetical protein